MSVGLRMPTYCPREYLSQLPGQNSAHKGNCGDQEDGPLTGLCQMS